jgi:hypothetical protein
MKKNRIWERFIVLLLFVTAWVVPSVADVCVYKPPSVRLVAGIVVDSSGRPIPGVNVAIIQSGESVASATTDDTGKFRFDWLREGAYETRYKSKRVSKGTIQGSPQPSLEALEQIVAN